jgi:hypothetical protein
VPNVFTPNLHGKNDVFKAILYGDVETFELIIYNRGAAVFFKHPIDTSVLMEPLTLSLLIQDCIFGPIGTNSAGSKK